MTTHSFPRVVADIGGTNARFGWQAAPGDDITHIRNLINADHAGVAEAVRSYLLAEHLPQPEAMAMGIATPVQGDLIRMTNSPWRFSILGLQAELGLSKLVVINDFTALALALPSLRKPQLRQIAGPCTALTPEHIRSGPVALLGAGTGLGVSGLLPLPGGRWAPISGEGGHVTLAATDALEAALLDNLRHRFEHVSAERVLCGNGLAHLYRAVAEVKGHPVLDLGPADISRLGLNGTDADAVATLHHFCAFLGSVAGNLALTLGARAGVYIGGGIVPRWGDFIERSPFHQRFIAKGRFTDYLCALPIWLIQAETSPALYGASRALDQLD
ncbi:glucokinase [Leptothrix ochracea]|uniref:glucokinase n=1 Tax=Leptothrix ochracea TaxID=735331 RepID=UPI0034E1B44A